MLKFLTILFIAIFNLEAVDSIPSWYFNPPSDDEFFYGIGEGTSLRLAKDEALNDIASRLSITISSKLSKDATQTNFNENTNYQQKVNQNLQSEVKKISFNNFEIVSTANNGSTTLVLLKVNKAQFLREQHDSLKEMLKRFDRLINNEEKKGPVELLQSLYLEEVNIDKCNTIASILKIHGNDYDKSILDKKLETMSIIKNNIKNKIEFIIVADDNSRYVADIIKDRLTALKLKIQKSSVKNANSVIIYLTTERNDKMLYSSFMTMVRTNMILKNNNGDEFYTSSFQYKGSSTLSYNAALQNGSKELQSQIDNIGILAFLGFV